MAGNLTVYTRYYMGLFRRIPIPVFQAGWRTARNFPPTLRQTTMDLSASFISLRSFHPASSFLQQQISVIKSLRKS